MSDVIESVFVGRNNEFSIEVKQNGAVVDFTTATRFVLLMSGDSEITIDTDINAGSIVGDDSGLVTFDIGLLLDSDDVGFYKSRLTVFDPEHLDGQVVVSSCSSNYPSLGINVC